MNPFNPFNFVHVSCTRKMLTHQTAGAWHIHKHGLCLESVGVAKSNAYNKLITAHRTQKSQESRFQLSPVSKNLISKTNSYSGYQLANLY